MLTESHEKLITVDAAIERDGSAPKMKAQKIWELYNSLLMGRVHKNAKFLDLYKMYRFQAKKRKFPWRANIYIPMGHTNVLINTAKLLTAIFASDPFFKAVARRQEYVQNEASVEQLMLAQHEEMELPCVFYDWLLDMTIFGVGILKMRWRYEEETEEIRRDIEQPVWLDIGGQLVQVGTEPKTIVDEVKEVTYDGPCAEVVSIFDFYVDPLATSIKNARYVMHRRDVTVEHLEKMAKMGIYDKEAVAAVLREKATGRHADSDKREIEIIEDEDWLKEKDSTIEIVEYVSPKRVVVVGPHDTLLRDGNNAYKRINFLAAKNMRNAHTFWGIGVNEPIISIQDALNDAHNIRFDNWKLIVQKAIGINMGAIYSPADLMMRPGQIVRFKPGYVPRDNMQELSMGSLGAEAYMEEDRLWKLNEIVTGVTEPALGVHEGVPDETATKARQVQAGISTRFGPMLITLEPVIQEFLQFQHFLNDQFLDYPRDVRVSNAQGYRYEQIGPEQVYGKYDFKFELNPVQGNRELWLQRILLIFNTFASKEFLAPMVNWLELSKRLLKAADMRNPDLLLNINQAAAMPPEQMAMMGALQNMMGPGGAMGGTNEELMQNPEQARLNAKKRMPQPTGKDLYRDMFAGMK